MMANKQWINGPPIDEFNQKLQQLVAKAQGHPPKSVQRQQALTQLLNEIFCCRYLARPQEKFWPSSIYEELYNEALLNTLEEICDKIDKHDRERPLMAWVNFLLKKRLLDAIALYKRKGMNGIPESVKKEGIAFIPTLEELDHYPIDEATTSKVKLVREFLQDDPEGLMQQARIRKPPRPSFQDLAWAKYVEDRTWDYISAQTGLSLQTLCCFFNRQLRKLKPYFQKYLGS